MIHLSSDKVHSRWNKDLEPVLTVSAGDTVSIEARDTSDNQIHPGFTMDDLGEIDTDRIHPLTPGEHGGNLDLKELGTGTKLYLPVFVNGALFSTGDCHAIQGDGEVTGAAVECAGKAVLTFALIKGTNETFPRAETATHYITLGFEEELTAAARNATERMINFISKEKNITESEAYSLCSIAADVRITQVVNGIMGAHVMMPKAIFLT